MAVVKYGFIACGAIQQRRHLPECAANPKSRVVAVFDPKTARARDMALKYGCVWYTDYRKMLKQADIDAVVIASPNLYHAPQTIDAFRAGKHVLVEKPMATSRVDAKKMIAEGKKSRKHLMIGLNQRLMPAHVKAREILASGKLGNVLSFRTAYAHPGPDAWSLDGAASWFLDAKQAVMGATGDLGVHKADLMRYLLADEFTHVGGFIETRGKKNHKGRLIRHDDNAYLVLKTRSGAIGTMIASWTNYGQSEANYTVIYCEKGALEIAMDPEYGVAVRYANGNVEKYKVGAIATNVKQIASGIIDSFTHCILRKKKPVIDGLEGYRAVNVIITAMEAAKAGKMLAIRG